MCVKLNAAQLRERLTQVNTKANIDDLIAYLTDTGCVTVRDKNLVEVEDDYIESVKFLMGPIKRGDIVYVFNVGLGLAVTDEVNRVFRGYKVSIGVDDKYSIDGRGHSEAIPAQNAIRIRPSTFDMAKVMECYKIRYDAYVNIGKATEVLTSLRET